MTDKKESILLAALELFAKEGYNATSTNKIAKRAGVCKICDYMIFAEANNQLFCILVELTQKDQFLSLYH